MLNVEFTNLPAHAFQMETETKKTDRETYLINNFINVGMFDSMDETRLCRNSISAGSISIAVAQIILGHIVRGQFSARFRLEAFAIDGAGVVMMRFRGRRR